jgi:acyl-CoA dehydrogenase
MPHEPSHALFAVLATVPPSARVDSLDGLDAVLVPSRGHTSSVDRAVHGGYLVDRLGYAFISGYRAALERLVPGIAPRACLAATESGGGHPRAMKATLRASSTESGPWRLDGHKTFVTLGTAADELLVVASIGESEGKNRLVVVRLPSRREGVRLVEREPLPFVPEVPHAEAFFDSVLVEPSEILPGDGYDLCVKPFRTVEDVHVMAATVGYVLSLQRRFGLERVLFEEGLAHVHTLRSLGEESPRDALTHLALGSVLARIESFVERAVSELERVEREERERFLRDRSLLLVAGKARAQRLEAARAAIFAT